MGNLNPLRPFRVSVSVLLSPVVNKHFIYHTRAVYLLTLPSEIGFPFAVTNVDFPPFGC